MNLNNDEKDNIFFSVQYYNIIKELNINYLNYIKAYNLISKDYYQKLSNLQKDNNIKAKQIINKMDKNQIKHFSQIINFIKVIPRIFDLYTENIDCSINSLEKEIISYQNFLIEKEILISKMKSQFDEAKKSLLKKENEINNIKNSFISNMTNIEEAIYKFYLLQ